VKNPDIDTFTDSLNKYKTFSINHMKPSIPSKQAFYIFSNGTLKRKENTIFSFRHQIKKRKRLKMLRLLRLKKKKLL
jgi:hypothetical protein